MPSKTYPPWPRQKVLFQEVFTEDKQHEHTVKSEQFWPLAALLLSSGSDGSCEQLPIKVWLTCKTWLLHIISCGHILRCSYKTGNDGGPSFGWCSQLPRNTPPPSHTHTCYSAEFSHSTSNSVSKSRDGLKKIGRSGAPPLKWRQADSLETYPSPTWATKQNLTTDGQMV